MENKISAVPAGNGVWEFACDGHIFTRSFRSSRDPMGIMKRHVDSDHAGEAFTLTRYDFSGRHSTRYVGKISDKIVH